MKKPDSWLPDTKTTLLKIMKLNSLREDLRIAKTTCIERPFQHISTHADSGVISKWSCWSGRTLIFNNCGTSHSPMQVCMLSICCTANHSGVKSVPLPCTLWSKSLKKCDAIDWNCSFALVKRALNPPQKSDNTECFQNQSIWSLRRERKKKKIYKSHKVWRSSQKG